MTNWLGGGWKHIKAFGLWSVAWFMGRREPLRELTVLGHVIDSMLCLSLWCIGFMTKAWRTLLLDMVIPQQAEGDIHSKKSFTLGTKECVSYPEFLWVAHMTFPEALGMPRMHKNSTFTTVIQIMLHTIQFIVCLLSLLVYSPFVHLALDAALWSKTFKDNFMCILDWISWNQSRTCCTQCRTSPDVWRLYWTKIYLIIMRNHIWLHWGIIYY